MSITINQSPPKYSPVRNEMIHVLSSTNTGQANFKYVLDLYILGVSTPAFFRKTRSADPTTGLAYFDMHSELRSYLSQDLDITTYGWQRNPNSGIGYVSYFGEQYGPSSGVTVYSGLTGGTTRYCWNGGLSFLGFKDYAGTEYTFSSAFTSFLSNAPTTLTIRSDENRWLYGINDQAGKADRMRIITYDSSNNIIQTAEVVNVYSGVTSDNDRFVRFGCGGNNLNLISSAQIPIGAQPIITASVAKYDVWAITSGGTRMSETRTFVINDACSKYTKYTIHFLNELGGFDTYSFILADRKDVDIQRDNMKQIVGSFSGGRFGYNKYDRQDTIYNTKLKDRITVNSDWVDSNTSIWLEELMTSPVVFLDDDTHGLVAINIVQNSYQVKNNKIDKLFNVSFQFEYAFDRFR